MHGGVFVMCISFNLSRHQSPQLSLSSSLESNLHDSGRQFPVCRRRRRDFLKVATHWTQCSAFAQSQEPRGQRRGPLLSKFFADADTQAGTNLIEKAERGRCALIPNADISFIKQVC